VTDKTNPKAITWLESTLPGSASAYKNDAEDLEKLRDEVRILEEGLISECERNSELQEQIIASRSRSDEMVAMMQLIRSETEAVLERYAGECVCCVRAQ
jgi:vacuolar-type H+-ATPase subunit I/STV1